MHRNGIAPLERRSRTAADGRPPRLGRPGDPVDAPVADGRSNGHTEVTPGDGHTAPDDGLTTSERALHASTVAVRVVALAAVAPPAARAEDGRRRVRQPEATEAS